MTTSFPADKTQPFVAENGVTYYWDSDRWRVKTYKKEDDSRLPYRLGTDKAARSGEPAIELVDAQDNYSNVKFFGVNGIDVESTISGIKIDGHQLIGSGDIDLSAYATIDYSDTEDEKLQSQIDELGVTKGKVARYTCSSITGGFASRPGQLAFNSGDPTAVNQISFGTEDSDNVLTKPMADGDIVEFVDAASSQVSRFKITDASGAPTGVEVEYISGDNDFKVGEEEQVYIYPQNNANRDGGGIPVGSIMMWINSKPPAGWFKLKGESFDVTQYPLLHAYLEASKGSEYTSGKLLDWRGHYPGQLGDHLNGDVGIKLPQQTAIPSGGAPYVKNQIPNGTTRTFNGAGGTSAYSDGAARPSVTEGWDDVTRPKTIAVHFIIKHD